MYHIIRGLTSPVGLLVLLLSMNSCGDGSVSTAVTTATNTADTTSTDTGGASPSDTGETITTGTVDSSPTSTEETPLTDTGGGTTPASPKLTWDVPTTYSDNTPIPPQDIKEYRVYYGTAPGAYTKVISSGTSTAVAISDLKNQDPSLQVGQTYYFAVTCVDITDMESDFSNEVSFQLP